MLHSRLRVGFACGSQQSIEKNYFVVYALRLIYPVQYLGSWLLLLESRNAFLRKLSYCQIIAVFRLYIKNSDIFQNKFAAFFQARDVCFIQKNIFLKICVQLITLWRKALKVVYLNRYRVKYCHSFWCLLSKGFFHFLLE